MRVDIFDVGHGECAVVTTPNGGPTAFADLDKAFLERRQRPVLDHFGRGQPGMRK